MNKRELHKQLEIFSKLISKEEIPNILQTLNLFAPIVDNLKNNSTQLLEESSNSQLKRREINATIQNAIKNEKGLSYRKIIQESVQIEDNLKKIKLYMQTTNKNYLISFSNFEKKLENFLESYEKHNRAYSISTCLPLSILASELLITINSTNELLKISLEANKPKEIDSEMTRVDLYLSNVESLKDFANKLHAFSEIYYELLSLYGVSESEYPLGIEHIENGSLWIKIAGHTLTGILLTSILTASTKFYQEEFTTSGKIQQLAVSVKTVESLLKIKEKLEHDGIDTTNISSNIESATKRISKKLDILLSDQPLVEINNIKYDIGESLSKKLIKEQKIKQLENKTTEK